MTVILRLLLFSGLQLYSLSPLLSGTPDVALYKHIERTASGPELVMENIKAGEVKASFNSTNFKYE
jgi:hypothetical protein